MMSTAVKDQGTGGVQMAGKQRAFNGRVTKFFETFGFVDDDVFFQLSVVKGGNIHIGDQVYVECTYSEQLPFKWNATKVEIIPQQSQVAAVASTYLQHRTVIQHQPREAVGQAQSYYTHDSQILPINQTQSLKLPQSQQQQQQPHQSQHQHLQQQQSQQQTQSHQQNHPMPQTFQQQPDQLQGYNTDYQQSPHGQNFGDYSTPKQMPFYSRQPVQPQPQQQQQQPPMAEYSSPNQFQQITYTSTPGSAFVSTQIIPFSQQVAQAAPQQQPLQQAQQPSVNQRSLGRSGSRWDEPRNREDSRIRSSAREDRAKFEERERERDREKMRERRAERERDRAVQDAERERREKERFERDKEHQRSRRGSESPVSTTSTADASHTGKALRRRYDPVNIPKFSILKRVLNIYDIKQRYGGMHIPSDFREVRVNCSLDVNVANIPKPILYRISNPKSEKTKSQSQGSEAAKSNGTTAKQDDDHTKKESKSSSCKYAVKVLFVSLPSMNDIYDRVFGSDRDNQSNSKAYFLHFNKLFSFLCTRNYSEGHSLIGGKFDASVDGYLNSKDEPNLIATAVRCVKQQTGIDLSSCRRWKQIATFVYDREESLKAESPLEYSYIFLPDVWSLFDAANRKTLAQPSVETNDDEQQMVIDENVQDSSLKAVNTEKMNEIVKNEKTELTEGTDSVDIKPNVADSKIDAVKPGESTNAFAGEGSVSQQNCELDPPRTLQEDDSEEKTTEPSYTIVFHPSDTEQAAKSEEFSGDSFHPVDTASSEEDKKALLARLNDLKVAELKTELERRGVKLNRNAKKVDLVNKLREIIEKSLKHEDKDDDLVFDSVKGGWWAKRIYSQEVDKKDEAELNSSTKESEEQSVSVAPSESTATDENCSSLPEAKEEVTSNAVASSANVSIVKRELQDDDQKKVKRVKSEDSNGDPSTTETSSQIQDGFIIAYGDLALTVISLYQSLNHHKHDHFELSVTAELLREFLIRHFASYILSTLVYNKTLKPAEKETARSPTKSTNDNSYVQLSFAYFDSCHCGYLMVEDLLRLFHNCNFSLSKKVWNGLFGSEDKQHYRSLKEPTEIIDYFHTHHEGSRGSSGRSKEAGPIYVHNGNIYDVIQLIGESELDEKVKAQLREKIKRLEEKIETNKKQISDFEARQKKMNGAIEKQNDEICSLKREKEALKAKYDQLRKCAEGSVQSFNEILKEKKDG